MRGSQRSGLLETTEPRAGVEASATAESEATRSHTNSKKEKEKKSEPTEVEVKNSARDTSTTRGSMKDSTELVQEIQNNFAKVASKRRASVLLPPAEIARRRAHRRQSRFSSILGPRLRGSGNISSLEMDKRMTSAQTVAMQGRCWDRVFFCCTVQIFYVLSSIHSLNNTMNSSARGREKINYARTKAN